MNVITTLTPSDQIPPNVIFFVDVTFWAVPFAVPSRDTIIGTVGLTNETVLQIIDVKVDYTVQVHCTLKCVINPVVDQLTVQEIDQYVMNILNYMSENVDRIYGITLNNNYFTNDDQFPDSSSVLGGVSTGGNVVAAGNASFDPSSSDLTTQVNDAANALTNAVKKAASGTTTSIIIILIIVVIGLGLVLAISKEV